MTVADYFGHWFGLLGHLEPETRDRYEQNWRVHLQPAFGGRRLRDLARGQIIAFLAQKRATRGRATVQSIHHTLSALLGAAVDDELLIGNPAAKVGRKLRLLEPPASKEARIDAKAMDLAQRDVFLATAYRLEPWYAPMWDVEVRIGVRPGEMYALEEEDFDLDGAIVHVRRQLHDSGRYVKTTLKGKRHRDVDLSPKVVALVRRQIERRKVEKLRRGWREMPPPLFCAPQIDVRVKVGSVLAQGYVNPGRVREALTRVLAACHAAQDSFPTHFTPHCLRHTFASLYLTQTAAPDIYYLERMLGHEKIKETIDTYGHWLKPNRPGGLDALDGDAAEVTS